MIPTLQRNIDQLDQLANGVDAGVQSVNENIGKLSSQSQAAVDTLKAGTTQLTSNNATLNGVLVHYQMQQEHLLDKVAHLMKWLMD